GPPDDRDPYVGVLVVGPERLEDRAAEGVVQRVALLGPVQRDAPHVLRRIVDQDHIGTHRSPSGCRQSSGRILSSPALARKSAEIASFPATAGWWVGPSRAHC